MRAKSDRPRSGDLFAKRLSSPYYHQRCDPVANAVSMEKVMLRHLAFVVGIRCFWNVRFWRLTDIADRRRECLLSGVKQTLFHAV